MQEKNLTISLKIIYLVKSLSSPLMTLLFLPQTPVSVDKVPGGLFFLPLWIETRVFKIKKTRTRIRVWVRVRLESLVCEIYKEQREKHKIIFAPHL